MSEETTFESEHDGRGEHVASATVAPIDLRDRSLFLARVDG